MPIGLYASEYVYQNELRRYPLAPHAEPTDVTGSFTLPDDLLVELYLPIAFSLNTNPAKYFLQSLTLYPAGVSLTIGYDGGLAGQFPVASTIVAFDALSEFTPVAMTGVGKFIATLGRVVFGKTANLLQQPFGSFTFSPSATPLDVDCIRPTLQSVSGITIDDGAGSITTLTGIVILKSGPNVSLSITDPQTIRIDAIDGAGLNESCACTEDTTTPIPITSINGITPDSTGALIIQGDNCLTVNTLTNGFQITDSCSDPCCGCAELEAITNELQNFSTVATGLSNFTNKLQGQVDQMTQVVIGSKLSDTGCVTCS